MIPATLLPSFISTTITLPHGQPWKPAEGRWFVISAYFPYSFPTSDAANWAFHQALRRRIRKDFPDAAMEEVKGTSADCSWQELSWAVEASRGPSEQQAIGLGRLFCQWAIFSVDSDAGMVSKRLIDCWGEP